MTGLDYLWSISKMRAKSPSTLLISKPHKWRGLLLWVFMLLAWFKSSFKGEAWSLLKQYNAWNDKCKAYKYYCWVQLNVKWVLERISYVWISPVVFLRQVLHKDFALENPHGNWRHANRVRITVLTWYFHVTGYTSGVRGLRGLCACGFPLYGERDRKASNTIASSAKY